MNQALQVELAIRSPSEYYIRYLISKYEPGGELTDEIFTNLQSLCLDGMDEDYLEFVARDMHDRPEPFCPENRHDRPSREFLKRHRIYDMWHPTAAVREAKLILSDLYLREKLEPLMLSSVRLNTIARKLRKYTSVALTERGITAYGHYFWNRSLLTQPQWQIYLGNSQRNTYLQGLMTSPDIAVKHLPWVMGIAGPSASFNSGDAAARIGQIAYKHALELEHKAATAETTHALRNCMQTIEKADNILRRSDVALHEVLEQFQRFKMKIDPKKVPGIQELTEGNFSKSGEGTDTSDEDF